MAIATTTVFDVRTTGADTNGGGFVRGASGTDYSQQNSPQYALSGIASAGAGATILSAAAASDMVGNIAQVISGTNFTTGFFQVLSVVVGVSITFSTNAAAANICTGVGASGVINIGGALATPGMAGAAHASANEIWVKNGTYTLSSSSSNVSGGRFTFVAGANGLPTMLRGYNAAHGDLGAGPTISAGAITAISMITGVANCGVENLTLDGNLQTTVRGIANSAATSFATNLVLKNFTNGAITGGAVGGTIYNSLISGCTTQAAVAVNAVNCVAVNCTANSFSDSSTINLFFINCICISGATGFGISSDNVCYGCIAYNCSGSGFSILSTSNAARCFNCISYGNTSNGFTSGTTKVDELVLFNCAAGGNGTDFSANLPAATRVNCVTLTANPFTNAAGNDFTLNNTVGGGAALKGMGIPSSFPSLSTTATPNIGPVQTNGTGGGSGSLILGG